MSGGTFEARAAARAARYGMVIDTSVDDYVPVLEVAAGPIRAAERERLIEALAKVRTVLAGPVDGHLTDAVTWADVLAVLAS